MTMELKNADIIIAGGGLAGLTLAMALAERPALRHLRIVLIERDDKRRNDRTWCFWADANEIFPGIVFHSWSKAAFYAPHVSLDLDMSPYRYHMIRGIDFYGFAREKLSGNPNITLIQAEITAIDAKSGQVNTTAGVFQAPLVFNSALRTPLTPAPPFTILLQHFKGWIIETEADTFDPDRITFMDYRLEQGSDTRFVYVLPVEKRRALVEFTVFSPELLPDEVYDAEIRNYVKEKLGITAYRITEQEFGVIPMTDRKVKPVEGRVIHIGTAGGFVKGSSGYAFLRTQRKIRAFVQKWEQTGQPDPSVFQSPWRFRFYDSVMLRVLGKNMVSGSKFFTMLFEKLPASLIFRFLDEDSTFVEDLKLLSVPPFWPFLKAAIRRIPTLVKI